MKKILIILALVPLLVFAGLLPKNVLAEMGTATWCGYCPNAYAGLEAMKTEHPVPDLVCVRYYSSSQNGGYANEETDGRIAYYGVTGYPTVIFNGSEYVVGASTSAQDGHIYEPVISSMLLEETTPFKIEVDLEIAGGTGTATINVDLFDDYSGDTPKIKVALIEDDVEGNHTNITRSVVTVDDVTITNEGQNQVFGHEFVLDGEWNTDNLYAVAFIQVDGSMQVLQSASSYPQPDYHFRVSALSEEYFQKRISPDETFSISFNLTNVGTMADDFTLDVDDSSLPSGWSATLNTVALANVNLGSYESAEFVVEIDPGGNTGFGEALLQVSSSNGGMDWEFPIRAFTNDVDFNLVDDDGGEDFEDYFTTALDAIGASYGVWDHDRGAFHLDNLTLDKTPVLIWSCGWSFPSLTKADRDLLRPYLANGGKLFLTGQDIGWDLCDSQSDNANADSRDFYNNLLHSLYVNDDANQTALTGVAGDPITDGMSFNIAGGDGADNQEYPSIIEPYDASGSTILTYSTGDGCAVRAESGLYKTVYLAFGYEAIDNATSRQELLENALDWLGPATNTGVDENPYETASATLSIEPISNGNLVAYYNLPAPQGCLEIYDVMGRRIESFEINEASDNLSLEVTSLPAGCYFVRLEAGDFSTIEKFVLVK